MGNELVQCHLGHFEGIGGFEKGMETGLEGVRQSLASREGESKGGRLGGGGTGQGCVCVCVRGVCVCVCVCVRVRLRLRLRFAEPMLILPPGQTSGSSRADGVSVRTYSC